MLEKSKRVEEDLSRWEKIVTKNKQEHEKRVQDSIRLIEEWNDKLSDSSSTKNIRINSLSKVVKNKSKGRTHSPDQESKNKEVNPEDTKILEARYNR